jgi:hypothetical protein
MSRLIREYIMLDKKTFVIAVLSLSAVILLVANLLAPRYAAASYSTIKDNDFQMQVATAPQGGDAVYITDNRSGAMAVLSYDPNIRSMSLVDGKTVQAAFAK